MWREHRPRGEGCCDHQHGGRPPNHRASHTAALTLLGQKHVLGGTLTLIAVEVVDRVVVVAMAGSLRSADGRRLDAECDLGPRRPFVKVFLVELHDIDKENLDVVGASIVECLERLELGWYLPVQ